MANDLDFADHLLDDTSPAVATEGIIGEQVQHIVETQEGITSSVNENGEEKNPLSVMYQFLQKKGIEDPSKIKFENDNEELEEYDFNGLSQEEQLTILEEVTDAGLSTHETEVINYLRTNNVTFDQAVNYFTEQRLKQYLEQNPDQVRQQTYSIDDYSDDELYLADLKSKYTTFSDEELWARLETAKSSQDLFNKEVEVLRKQYKAAEDKDRELEKQQEDQQYEDLKNNLIGAASYFNEISLDHTDPKSDSLVIEEQDKHQLLAYLLNQDTDGKSQFVKDLQDPQVLIELAWFRTQGLDVISGITKYWKDALKSERKKIAELEKQIASSSKKETNTVVIPTPPKNGETPPPVGSIWGNMNLI